MIFKDLLQVNDPEKPGDSKYSQSRVYLMLTFLMMVVVILLSIFTGITVAIVEAVTNVLWMMLLLFSGYSLTGKGMKTLENIKSKIK